MSKVLNFIKECNANLIRPDKDEYINARDYCSDRNISEKTIEEHLIGYCPNRIGLPEEVYRFGVNEQDKEDKDFSYYIRGKLIIPIFSEFGDLIGFSTRKPTTEKGFSWWNVPFKKKNHLFLLNKSRKNIFESNKVYLVEGYIDAIILYQNGIKNVCGIMGTAFSVRKAALIARYCNNVCFCFDVDANRSGQESLGKSIEMISGLNFCDKISMIDGLPVGEDPDVFVCKNGANKFLSLEKILSPDDIQKICEENKKKKQKP